MIKHKMTKEALLLIIYPGIKSREIQRIFECSYMTVYKYLKKFDLKLPKAVPGENILYSNRSFNIEQFKGFKCAICKDSKDIYKILRSTGRYIKYTCKECEAKRKQLNKDLYHE